MKIPAEATFYLLLQRTQYLGRLRRRWLSAIDRMLPFPYYSSAVARYASSHQDAVHAAYIRDMEQEYRSIAGVLPDNCKSILDIGCGLAGIDLHLYKHYKGRGVAPRVHLLDKTATESNVYYGFKRTGAFYNSLKLSRAMLIDNGILSEDITLIEVPDSDRPKLPDSCDLVISLISWGFHYPVSLYLDDVVDALSESGVLILDVRIDTDGLDLLSRAFRQVTTLLETHKYRRVVCRQ